MNEEQQIELGKACDKMLAQAEFVTVLRMLEGHYISTIVQGKPEERKEREIAYYQLKALQDVLGTMNHYKGIAVNKEQKIEPKEVN
tara:strand:- start:890 stop:1147 length:258 start_codon:yes stop_codon:yes gene_type:complete